MLSDRKDSPDLMTFSARSTGIGDVQPGVGGSNAGRSRSNIFLGVGLKEDGGPTSLSASLSSPESDTTNDWRLSRMVSARGVVREDSADCSCCNRVDEEAVPTERQALGRPSNGRGMGRSSSDEISALDQDN